MPPAEPLLDAVAVSRRFGYRWVVRKVDLAVHAGEVILLIGGNGAGKTTLLRVMAGLLKANTGRVIRRSDVGMVAHSSMLYDALTARENLQFVARLHGVDDQGRLDALLERIGLAHVGDERIATFSRGMLQRLAIARALLHEPQVLLLDEPLTGLDDAASRIVLDLIAELQLRRAGLVIATHQLIELVGVAGSVGYMVNGRLAAHEPVHGRDAREVMARYRELMTADAA
ncbi:MAG: ABC transporter ATP-binding protein [Gemmatimonadales bacterium]|jgi:heme exporter protein A